MQSKLELLLCHRYAPAMAKVAFLVVKDGYNALTLTRLLRWAFCFSLNPGQQSEVKMASCEWTCFKPIRMLIVVMVANKMLFDNIIVWTLARRLNIGLVFNG